MRKRELQLGMNKAKTALRKWLLVVKKVGRELTKTKLYIWLDPRNYTGTRRVLQQALLLAMTGLLLFSAISPLIDLYVTHRYYSLNSSTSGLVGSVSDTLAKQITYDSTRAAYVFNASGMTPATQTVGPDKVPLALLQAKVAGNNSKSKSTYSVVMPTDPKAGISYYDSNTGLSFQLVPNFTEMGAQQIDNHIVYPTSGNTQMVYSVKHNGLKEDIVLKQYVSDSLSFSYSLKLPKTLEARLLTDGSGFLGIYSADPSLFNNATSGSDYDPAKIESAQLHAQKDHLVFAIPAPVINQTDNRGQRTENSQANAYFKLSPDGQTLTVSANNLRGLHYPITVDPTVVITSTSDFSTGNNEDNNISYPANQISRGSLTGGSVSGGWTGTTVLPASNQEFATVTYNGYIYDIGGWNGTAATANVYYASLNSNGTIGSWTATTAIPVATTDHTAVTYNGYIYVIGGGNGSLVTTVYYAAINFNGSIGAWATTTALPVATDVATSVAYNGYIYEIGGGSPTVTAAVYYAPINANGTIGSWTATTSLPVATYHSSSVAYNGYLYEIGGTTGSATAVVDYAPINANGTLGSWYTTTSLPVAVWGLSAVAFNGYLYSMGGFNGSAGVTTVYYAPINANGTVGTWTATAAMLTSSYYGSANVYNGYVYALGGAGSNTSVSYAKIDPAGMTTAYSTTTALPAATSTASSVAYNGYVYEIGGGNPSVSTTVDYAPINANGTIGTWTATTALPAATYGSISVAYNGYLYEIGGNSSSYVAIATVDYAPINANGTIGAWTATTSLPIATGFPSAVVYNGYVYVVGGETSGGTVATVDYAPINANGTIGAWTATTSLPSTSTKTATAVVYNGYIYEIGGYNGTSSTAAVYYAPINANGTVGTWTAATSLPAPTNNSVAVAYNGYIYEVGGSSSGAPTASVYYTPINANGSIGSWVANTSLPIGTQQATAVVYNGYIYEIGGYTTANVTTVYYAAINNGGPGTAGSWTATTVLPTATYAATSAVYNGYLYEIGGYTTAGVATVEYAPINANGTIGAWTATTSLPAATYNATSVAYNGYLYEIGGYNPSASTTVEYALINTNGTIGAWTATTSLPATTVGASSVVYNGYLYEIGGSVAGSNSTTVEYAFINANGTIGAWTAATSLPATVIYGTSVVYNGYLYEIGADTVATVYYAPINANGTIGAWTATTALLAPVSGATSIAYNGYLYEIGGYSYTTTAYVNSVAYAPINANGTIGAWTATTVLPTINYGATTVVYNGYIYEVGGYTNAAINAVSYAPLNVMPRVGHYSQLFNFGSAGITPFSITYNGNLPNANGLSSIQYKTAGTNAILGSSQYSTALNGTTTDCNTVGTIQYVSVDIALDDSSSAAFPDVNTTPANVTDFTVTYNTYHPSPNLRLRGGKYFSNNILQALDTCAFVPVPNTPTIGTATDNGSGRPYNNGLATVSFTPSPTGYAATSYRVTASSGGYSGTGTTSPITVNGLQSGVSYTFTVTASNAIGASNPSLASNSITTTTVPQAPTIGTATAGVGSATVAYTANGAGGLSNTYTATSSPSSITGTGASPITVSGLTSGTSYTFTVTATNANGSAVSGASNSVTIPPIVTGGTLASDATYYYRTFTGSGTLGITGGSVNFDVLVIAGGAGGSGYSYGGAGGSGAGGVLYSTGQVFSSNQSVTVGGGGAGSYSGGVGIKGSSGGNSSLGSLTAIGGGGGGVPYGGSTTGNAGGSGGGGSGAAPSTAGVGTSGQGNSGGTGNSLQFYASGGGGGAGGVGASPGQNGPGNGGIGTNAYASWATATSTGVGGYYAGGGGGTGYQVQSSAGTGGAGGGGAGNNFGNGTDGTPNTGSGGGSGGGATIYTGGNGGSGIVIVRYTRAQVGG